jgi:hypothetical protein
MGWQRAGNAVVGEAAAVIVAQLSALLADEDM